MIITFCGHRNLFNINKEVLKEKIFNIFTSRIPKECSVSFYLGRNGAFDILAKDVCVKYKKEINNSANIIFVTPYLNINKEEEKHLLIEGYTEIFYPSLEKTPPKFCIPKRNEFMVKNSDLIIAYVKYNWGGSGKSLEKAKRLKKQIINLAN